MKIKIRLIIDALEMVSENTEVFYDTRTGDFLYVSLLLDSDNAIEKLEDDPDRYIRLPSKKEINVYNIIEQFSSAVEDESVRSELLSSIQGKGAFRRFNEIITKYNLLHLWYSFKENSYREIAVSWCKENCLDYQ